MQLWWKSRGGSGGLPEAAKAGGGVTSAFH